MASRGLTPADEATLLDEVLFHVHEMGEDLTADEVDPQLERIAREVARAEKLDPSDEDIKACCALAYEQLAAR